jgi:hypothetical protein
VSHSHLPVQHLIRKVELKAAAPRQKRDVRPIWLTTFIEQVSELFETYLEPGRVGFECQLDETRWHVSLFLGSSEFVGGIDDGRVSHLDFRFDICRLYALFQRVDKLVWNVFPPEPADEDAPSPCSNLHAEGMVGTEPIILRVYAFAPEEAGPGLRCKENGSWELV